MPAAPPKHRPAGWVSAQEYDRQRGSSAKRGYDAEWRRIRAGVLAEEPHCRTCAAQGERVKAVDVDHIDGNVWNRARSNLRPLCKPCHSRRTARDQGFARPGLR